MAPDGGTAPGGGVLVRHQRHQRPRDPGGGTRTRSRARGITRDRRPRIDVGRVASSALGDLRQDPRGASCAGEQAARLPGGSAGAGRGRGGRGVLVGHLPDRIRPPRRRDRDRPGRAHARAGRAGPGRARHQRRPGHVRGRGAAGRVRVPGPGIAVGRDGRRAARLLARVRPAYGGVCPRAEAVRGLGSVRSPAWRVGRAHPRLGRRRAAGAVGGHGLAGGAVALLWGRAVGGGGTLPGRDRGGVRCRRSLPRRRRPRGVSAQPDHRRAAGREGRHGLGGGAGRAGARSGVSLGRTHPGRGGERSKLGGGQR
ncbi:hypothetical protein NOGI109294_09335 [Nocardiopsis gilva]